VPRTLDERAAADLFFADLTGQPMQRSMALAEDNPPARSAVLNPGWSNWVVMIASQPAKRDAPRWAGAIRSKTDASSDYTGWEHRSESFTIDKLTVGTSFDMLITANVKGRLKGTDDPLYVMDATVAAFAPRDFSATRRRVGGVDVEVGFEDDKKKLHFVKASWDYDKGCARLDIPVRVTFNAKGLRPDDFTWFGNGDPPITPFSPTP
jgi:hypothetical protein